MIYLYLQCKIIYNIKCFNVSQYQHKIDDTDIFFSSAIWNISDLEKVLMSDGMEMS